MKKISYSTLQKKYAGKIVALNKGESQVLAVGKKFSQLFRQLKSKKLDPQECLFVGPVQKSGTINVYHYFSLHKKDSRRR